MPEDHSPRAASHFATRLSHVGRAGTKIRGFVNPPVHRGSTMLAEDTADRAAMQMLRFDQAPTYGVHGNATHHALEDAVAEIEGGTRCQIVSSGLAAVTTPLLTYLDAGQHVPGAGQRLWPGARASATNALEPVRDRDDVLRSHHRRRWRLRHCSSPTPRCSI